jgi:DNA-binding transcriptional regulator PaaX
MWPPRSAGCGRGSVRRRGCSLIAPVRGDEAGAVASRRDGKMVMYSLTDRGRELLAVILAREAVA